MRVLLVNNHQATSGIGRVASSLYPALKTRIGENVKMYDCSNRFLDQLFYRSHGRLLFPATEIVRTLSLVQSMIRMPRPNDIYHFLTPVLLALSPPVRPRVVTVHDMKFPTLKRKVISDYVVAAMLRSLKDADLVICVSSFTARIIGEKIDIDENKIAVIPLGVDHSRFRPREKSLARHMLGIPDDVRVVLHVGSDEERKNVSGLFRIFRRVLNQVPNAVLLRIGITGTKYPPQDISSSVRLIAPTDELLPYYYNAADIFAFPSILEGFGLPLLEAMASGTPTVTSNVASIPEVVGEAALTLDPHQEDEFADSVTRVLKDRGLSEYLVARGLSRAAKFSWDECARLTQDAYATARESV